MSSDRAFFEGPSAEEILRDRLILYVRALKLPPTEGLRLVLAVMERGAPVHEALRDLRRRVQEAGCGVALVQEEGRAFSSVPPYNRGTMPPAPLTVKGQGRARP